MKSSNLTKLSIAAQAPKSSTPVLFSLPDRPATLDALTEKLSAADQQHLKAVLAGEKQKEFARLVLCPSGKLVVVIGTAKPLTHRRALLLARQAVRFALIERLPEIAFSLEALTPAKSGYASTEFAQTIATQCVVANYEYDALKTPPKDGRFRVKAVMLVSSNAAQLRGAVAAGLVIGEEMNGCRDLANMPGGDMTPATLAQAAQAAGKRAKFSVKVLGVREMTALGMGGVLGVGKGSSTPPRFIIMQYLGGKKGSKPVVLCGKGVTFDTGGLNLKPSNAIYEMHMDMSGGAAVIHVLAALARLKAPVNVIGLVPAVENMPSGASYRPGDVLKTISGKTIEVLNTDAEGRVVLADALGYAERLKPSLVVDIATLTGAAMVALGKRATALFATDDAVAEKLSRAGELTGDLVWRMPLWEEFETEVEGTFGDVANIGKHSPAGGAATGAAFLWQFAKNYPWAHLDIAPRMTSVDGDQLAKGAIAASVPLLVAFLRRP